MSEFVEESKLRNAMNRMRTNSLVIEYCNKDREGAVFTLAEQDKHGLLSLHRLYMEIADPTEYEFAMRVFGSWAHWKLFHNLRWFKPYLDAWRDELEIKIRSDAIKKVIEQSKDEKNSNAAKWLAEKKWKLTRGRPSKEEVTREVKVEAKLSDEVDEMYATLN